MSSNDITNKANLAIISTEIEKIKEMNNNLNDSLIYTTVKFANFLRDKGYTISTSTTILFCEVMSNFDILDKEQYKHISKSIFCSSRIEYTSYENLFEVFFCFDEGVNLSLELNKKIKDSKNIIKGLEKEYSDSLNNYINNLNKESKLLKEKVIKSRLKVYRLHSESLMALTNKDKDYLARLINKSCSHSPDYQRDFTRALIFLDKIALMDSLSKSKVDFKDVTKNIQNAMLNNFKDADAIASPGRIERINEALISSAGVLTRIKKDIFSIDQERESKINIFKLKAEDEIESLKDKYNNDISKIKMKLSTLNHRDEFIEGYNSVIELEGNCDKTISKLSKEEYTFLKYYINLNASKFRTKLGRSMRKYKSKVFDVKKTVQECVKFNGSPVKYYYKKPSVKKYKLVCILDISGSVSKYLEILLAFFYEISSVFNGGVEFYGFVSTLMDFTDVFKNGCLEDVVESIKGYRGYSNYGKAILDFYENNYKKIDSNTIILYFGDARNNSNKSQVDILETINKKVKYSVWLNPEETEKWNNGDSIIGEYSKCVNDTYCVNTAEQLIDFLNNFSVDKSL